MINERTKTRKSLSQFGHFPEYPGIRSVSVIQHGAVELFKASPSFPPLEIQYGIRSVCHYLHAGKHVHTRTLQRIRLAPADRRRRAFHQKERRFQEGAHQTVIYCCLHRRRNLIFLFVPVRIIVPGNDIHSFFQSVVVHPFEKVHKVRCSRKIRIFFYRPCFQLVKVIHLLRGKPSPVQHKSRARRLAVWNRTVNLLPVRIGVAPEVIPPRPVQILKCTVLFLKPDTECRLAVFTMANGIREVSSKLIGNMPENHIASFSEPLCQFPVNCRDFLTHHR